MLKKRLIANLLLREGLIVQSFGFNKYLPVGRPRFSIENVVKWDVDEIILLDMSAAKESRMISKKMIEMISQFCFVPLTVGGGITKVSDVRQIIRAGADKVSINTNAIRNPNLIAEIADVFGSQCIVISIDCKKKPDNHYYVHKNYSEQKTDLELIEWVKTCERLGAGELLINSVDRDGSRLGYDEKLIEMVCNTVSIPVICCGGVGKFEHFASGIKAGASAVAAANIFHHLEHSTILAKAHMAKVGIDVRLDSIAKYEGRDFDVNGRLVMLDAERLLELESEIKRKREEL